MRLLTFQEIMEIIWYYVFLHIHLSKDNDGHTERYIFYKYHNDAFEVI
jgi:hypothetical protein